MRFFKYSAAVLVSSYLAACLLVSAFASAGFQRWHWIETRGPLFLVSVERVQIVGPDDRGVSVGLNQHGEPVWYREDLRPGAAAVSVFVYSPFSGIDGIEWRFDHIITQ